MLTLNDILKTMGIIYVAFLVIAIIVAVLERAIKKRKEEKHLQELRAEVNLDPESYIPKSMLHSTFKCQNCGASVPSKTDDHITMICPFCHASLAEAKALIDKAQQSKQYEQDYNLELKRLAERERQQKIEHENIMLQQMIQKKEQRTHRLYMIIILFSFALMLFLILGAAGVFK